MNIFNHIEFLVLAPAVMVGALVALTHIPLGVEVFKKGIIFIDIAIAQAAALGVIFAEQMLFNYTQKYHFIAPITAFLAAILAATALTFTDKKFPKLQEAIIGSFFVVCSGLAMILLSSNPHGAEDFENVLAGQILWSSFADVLWLCALYLPISLIWFGFKNKINGLAFYLLFAITITASVQIIGVYLVFSFLIFPAFVANALASSNSIAFATVLKSEEILQTKKNETSAQHSSKFNLQKFPTNNYKKQISFAYLIALLGLFFGILISTKFDFPTGPTISLSLAFTSILACLLIKIFQGLTTKDVFKQ